MGSLIQNMELKLAVIGGRDFDNWDLLHSKLLDYMDRYSLVIVSGGANGADSLAEKFADMYGIPKDIYHADWEQFGKSAGFIRNKQIIDAADFVLAFWDGVSKGTQHSIGLAKKQKKETHIVYY